MNNKKILVIHPADPSTDMLCDIYRDINATVIRQKISKSRLKQLMVDADRIIMLGHGTHTGMGFVERGFITPIIDASLVYILREKKDSVFIWCNADEFVKKYKLHGFSTGMFISETEEAYLYNVKATVDEIYESNARFSRVVRNNLHRNSDDLCAIVKEDYDLPSDVAKFNNELMYSFK